MFSVLWFGDIAQIVEHSLCVRGTKIFVQLQQMLYWSSQVAVYCWACDLLVSWFQGPRNIDLYSQDGVLMVQYIIYLCRVLLLIKGGL